LAAGDQIDRAAHAPWRGRQRGRGMAPAAAAATRVNRRYARLLEPGDV